MENETITLKCPQCKKEIITRRMLIDPKEAVVVEVYCDNCDPQMLHLSSVWYDAEGKEVKKLA